MSSNGSVRRPRIRTDSERDRRRQNDRANYARKKKTFKTKSRVWYDKHKSNVASKRRSHRQRDADAFYARRSQRETNRRKAFLSDLLRRLESVCDGNEDIATLHETLSSRMDALCAVRERLGVPTLDGEPCEHCGAHLFAQGHRGMCCKHGKFFQGYRTLQRLYTSSDPKAQKFRKESRAYNCRVNFASMNVEDRELKKMFGDHLLSVQGR